MTSLNQIIVFYNFNYSCFHAIFMLLLSYVLHFMFIHLILLNLILCMLGKNFSGCHSEIFSLSFSLSLENGIRRIPFSGKKNIISLWSAEFSQGCYRLMYFIIPLFFMHYLFRAFSCIYLSPVFMHVNNL